MRKLLNIIGTAAALAIYLQVLPFPIGYMHGFIAARFFRLNIESVFLTPTAVYSVVFVVIAYVTYRTYRALANFYYGEKG